MANSLNTDQTGRMIASDRVEGTVVYDFSGERLGSISNIMIDKVSGQAEYAVMQFGGFLGIGTDNYPIPWRMLQYDVDQGGYVVDFHDAPGDRGTRVRLIIAYKPPGGSIGKGIAKLMGAEPHIQARRDLKRFKMLMETGEIATSARRKDDTSAPSRQHEEIA